MKLDKVCGEIAIKMNILEIMHYTQSHERNNKNDGIE